MGSAIADTGRGGGAGERGASLRAERGPGGDGVSHRTLPSWRHDAWKLGGDEVRERIAGAAPIRRTERSGSGRLFIRFIFPITVQPFLISCV